MLVLSRKLHESILFKMGDLEVKVTIVEMRGGQKVRVGIVAPKEVTILREELLGRMVSKNKEPKEQLA